MVLFMFMVSIIAGAAGEVVLPGPKTSEAEYRAYLAAHRDLRSPTAAWEELRPTAANRELLLTSFADAQEAYLSGDTEVARQRFKATFALLTEDDWGASERALILQAALRLAQLAVSADERAKWLSGALAVDPRPAVDKALFPPPLMEALAAAQARTLKKKPALRGWRRVLVNGVPCDAGSCPEFFQTDFDVRLTWLSDYWVPMTKKGPLTFSTEAPKGDVDWIEGDCANHRVNKGAAAFAKTRAYFGLECLKTSLKPKEAEPLGRLAAPPPEIVDRPHPPLYKSPWLWAGVGTVVAIFIVNRQSGRDHRDPSTTYGY